MSRWTRMARQHRRWLGSSPKREHPFVRFTAARLAARSARPTPRRPLLHNGRKGRG